MCNSTEEETMSDDELTHEWPDRGPYPSGPARSSAKCIYCGDTVYAGEKDNPCPEHSDRQREDEGDKVSGVSLTQVMDVASEMDIEFEQKTYQEVVDMITEHTPDDWSEISEEERRDRIRTLLAGESLAGILNYDPDQPAEDDDDGEPDMICYTDDVDESAGVDDGEGELFDMWKRGEIRAIPAGLDEAIREHCELADGVCEWTYVGDCAGNDQDKDEWGSGCGEIWKGNKDRAFWQAQAPFDYCPYCGGCIEITTDEGGEYEVGDLVRITTGDMEGQYELIIGYVNDDPYRYKVVDKKGETSHAFPNQNPEKYLEKVGTFAPDDDALERVNPDCNGSLFVETNADENYILFDPLCRTKAPDEPTILTGYLDNGKARHVSPSNLEATGIVLESFHQIAEVSDYE